MAFVLVIAGLIMIITGAKGTYAEFGSQVVSDVEGQYIYYAAAIGGIGALGYIDALRTFSRLFMGLILIVLVLSNGGFASKFTAALKQGPQAPQLPSAGSTNQASSAASGGSNAAPTLKQSLNKPGGGGFWDWAQIPTWLRPSWAK